MRLAPSATAIFGGGGDVDVHSVRIIESEFGHERAVVTVHDADTTARRYGSGTPVLVQWGVTPTLLRTFIGYVNHSEPVHESSVQGEPKVRVVCMGPSWVTQREGTRTYRRTVATGPIRDIAEEYRFDTSQIDHDTYPWPTLHQAGSPDWDFMVECARRIGWALVPRGLTLVCRDRATLIRDSASRAPVLSNARSGGSVTYLRPSLGVTSPQGGHRGQRRATALNPRTLAPMGATSRSRGAGRALFDAVPMGDSFSHVETGAAYSSLGEAFARLEGAERLNSLGVEAVLRGTSHPNARVGSTVAVTGFGAAGDGLWYVTAADHTIGPQGASSMELRLGRDSVVGAVSTPPSTTNARPPARGARLVNEQWVLA